MRLVGIAALLAVSVGPALADDQPKDTTKAKPPKVTKADPDAIDIDPDLLPMTNDPIVGKADKIEGTEMQNVVAFTFDDGPNPATTPAVIDALQKYNIPATFFIITQRISGKTGAKSRDVLATEVAGGFIVGSHSVTHPNLRAFSQKQLAKEIDASIKVLSPAIGKPVGIFRAPYGALGAGGRARLKKLGVTETFWSIDTVDWGLKSASKDNVERLRKRTISMIEKQHGGVVLMHDRTLVTAKTAALIFDDLEALNCKRLADAAAPPPTDPKAKVPPKLDPIIPVSIHYFLRDGKSPRALPEEVKARTEAYKVALPARCAARQQTTAPPASAVDNHIKPH